MELLLRDINDLPPFGFLQIDHGTDEFWVLLKLGDKSSDLKQKVFWAMKLED
jgi:hypothetical protein